MNKGVEGLVPGLEEVGQEGANRYVFVGHYVKAICTKSEGFLDTIA